MTRDADGYELPPSMTSKATTIYVRHDLSPPGIGEIVETVYRRDEDGNWEDGRDPYLDGVFARPPEVLAGNVKIVANNVKIVAGVRSLAEMRAL